MPHQYQAKHQASITASRDAVTPLLFDLAQWPSLMGWHQYININTIHISTPSIGVTAHSYIKHDWGEIEISFHYVSDNTLKFNVLFNHEHSAIGHIQITQLQDKALITSTLSGSVNNYLFGGFASLYITYLAEKMLISSFNNLESLVKLQESQ